MQQELVCLFGSHGVSIFEGFHSSRICENFCENWIEMAENVVKPPWTC